MSTTFLLYFELCAGYRESHGAGGLRRLGPSADVRGPGGAAAWTQEIQAQHAPSRRSTHARCSDRSRCVRTSAHLATRRRWLIALALFALSYVFVSFFLPSPATQRVASAY